MSAPRVASPVSSTDTYACSVGDAAKNAFASNPRNTVFDAKRLIGRKVDDPDIAKDIKHWPFKVSDKGGKPVITVKYKGEDKDFVRIPLYFWWNLVAEALYRPPRRFPPWFSAR